MITLNNNTAEMLRQRSQRFHDAVDFQKTDRIPNLACVVAWKILDAGYSFEEAFHDDRIMERCVRQFVERYSVDAISDPGAGSAYKLMDVFGTEGYFRAKGHRIDVTPFCLAEAQELPAYLENREEFLLRHLLPRKIPQWKSKTREDFRRALEEQAHMENYGSRITRVLQEEYGMPLLSSSQWGVPTPLIETLLHPVRGVRGLSCDLHRIPEQLDELIAAEDGKNLRAVIEQLDHGPAGHDYRFCFDLRTVIRTSCLLSRKQFERYYWRSMKPVFDACARNHKHILVMVEGSGAHIFDLFRDYPRGVITLMIEHDDPFALRRQLPNVAIAGGMPLLLLGHGTPRECVAHTKRLVQELATEGGYIFCQSNFMCYPNDARRENLLAVCDWLTNGTEV